MQRRGQELTASHCSAKDRMVKEIEVHVRVDVDSDAHAEEMGEEIKDLIQTENPQDRILKVSYDIDA